MALVLGIVGGAVAALGAIQSANAQAAAANYNAKVAKRNRDEAIGQTHAAIADKVMENNRQMGSIRAAYGASGLQLDGSPLDVLEDTATEQAYDVAKIRYKGRMQAAGYSEQAALSKLEAKSAKTAGYIGAASAIIGGVSTGISNSGSSGSSGYSFDLG
jgi:hypothetical protein